MDTIKAYGAQLLPVDSEHNAVFQCLESASEKMRQSHRIILTASGGPFRKRMDLSTVTDPSGSMEAPVTVTINNADSCWATGSYTAHVTLSPKTESSTSDASN